MRIALIHYACAPVVGGVERVIAGHARLLERHGHEVTLVCQHGGAGANVVTIPREGAAECLREVCERQELVIVHNVMTMPFDPALTFALAELPGRLPGVRFIAWTHDIAACNPDLAHFAPEVSRAFVGFEYVAVSELRSRQLDETVGVCARVVPNGVEPVSVLGLTPDVARLTCEASLLDGRIVLLHPARILRRKNIECGIRVVAAIKAAGCEAALVVTGAEDPHNAASRAYGTELRRLRTLLGVQREVVFAADHFRASECDVAALYRVADALIYPSRSEGFGLPVVEAVLHALPVFCADIEPLRSVARESAMLFRPDDSPEQIAARVVGVLRADVRFKERKAALRESSWEAVYARHLAAILAGATES